MGKKTILRIEDGAQLSPTQLNNLKSILGSDFEIQPISQTVDMQRSYSERAASFEASFRLIVKSVTRQSKGDFNSEAYLNWAKEQYAFPKNVASWKNYQTILKEYTCKLLDALVTHWVCHEKPEHRWEEAVELLNKAEQYNLMMQGRPDVATLTRTPIYDDDNFVLEWDKQLPPVAMDTLPELNKIKSHPLSITPDWFRALAPHLQLYLHGLLPVPVSIERLKSRLNDFIVQWNDIKKTNKYLIADLQKIKHKSDLPAWYVSFPSACSALIAGVLEWSDNAEADITGALNALSAIVDDMQTGNRTDWTGQLVSLNGLPFWYLCLPAHEQQLLKHVLKSSKDIQEVTSFIPSRLRTLPCVANFGEQVQMILDKDAFIIQQFDGRLRSSHGGSRDVKNFPEQVISLHTQRNGMRIREEAGDKPLLLQTLISPVQLLDKVIPDYFLDQQRQAMVSDLRQEKNAQIYTSNHPFNVARYILWTSAKDKECLTLLQGAQNMCGEAVYKKRLVLLKLPSQDEQALASLIKHRLAVIDSNKTLQVYQWFDSLGHSWDLSQITLSLVDWLTLVQQASNSVKSIINTKQPPVSATMPLKDAAGMRQALVHWLYHHREILNYSNWQSLVGHQLFWCSLGNKNKAAASLLKQITDLALLVNEYEATLNSGTGSATWLDYNGRELYLSSLENLLITHMQGKSYGSCVSGKDRKAIELMHTNAMLLYREKYGIWPSYNDSGLRRSHFADLVAARYLTRHAHFHAGQNAPGSNGVKTPKMYFPSDIALAITQKAGDDALDLDDVYASNNEVKSVVSNVKRVDGKNSSYIEAAKKLQEKDRKDLLLKLKAILGEKKFWQKKTMSVGVFGWQFVKLPKGIAEMKAILDQASSSSSTLQTSTSETILASIYQVVEGCSATNKKRDPITQKIYVLLAELLVSKDPQSIVAEKLKILDDIKNISYSYNTESLKL